MINFGKCESWGINASLYMCSVESSSWVRCCCRCCLLHAAQVWKALTLPLGIGWAEPARTRTRTRMKKHRIYKCLDKENFLFIIHSIIIFPSISFIQYRKTLTVLHVRSPIRFNIKYTFWRLRYSKLEVQNFAQKLSKDVLELVLSGVMNKH